MSDKKTKLEVMVKRGGTVAERQTAQKLLDNQPKPNLPEVYSEESNDKWTQMGVLIRTRKGVNAHLKGPALQHMLKSLKDGQVFTNRTVPLCEEFGTGDFYTILSWMMKFGLVKKDGSRYTIPSRKNVMVAWNNHIDQMRFKI